MGFSKLTIVLGLDTKNFTRQLQTAKGKVTSSAQKMSKALNRLGFKKLGLSVAAAGAAILLAMKKYAAAGDELDKMSLRTGILVEDLSRLGHAAQISGTDIQTMKDALRFVAKNMDLAKRGMGEGAVAFKEIGFKVTDADGKLRKVTDVLFTVADAMAEMENATSRSALAAQIFGQRYGEKLLPMLRLGSLGIRKLMKESDKLGITWNKLQTDQAAKLTDQLTRMQGVIAGIGRDIVSNFVPSFIRMVDVIKNNRRVIIDTLDALGKIAGIGGAVANRVRERSFFGQVGAFAGRTVANARHNVLTSAAVHRPQPARGFGVLRGVQGLSLVPGQFNKPTAGPAGPGGIIGGAGGTSLRGLGKRNAFNFAQSQAAKVTGSGVGNIRQPIDDVTANIRQAQAVWMDFQSQVQFGWEGTLTSMLRGTVSWADATKRLLNTVLDSFISSAARFGGQQLFGATLGRFSTGAQVGVAQISNLTSPSDPMIDVIKYGGSSNG